MHIKVDSLILSTISLNITYDIRDDSGLCRCAYTFPLYPLDAWRESGVAPLELQEKFLKGTTNLAPLELLQIINKYNQDMKNLEIHIKW